MQPSLEEWRELYEAAVAFRDAAPWQWMWDSDQFGVQDPESGQIGYCCVMGRLGEHFALAVYIGTEGLAGLWKMREAGPRAHRDPAEVLSWQNCLMASFEDRSLLRKEDLETIKALGLKFRGRSAWPWFRSYRPGYAPWFFTAPEVRFVTLCLRQGLEVAERFRRQPDLLPEARPKGPYFVRVPEKQGNDWIWNDTLQQPAPLRPAEMAAPPVDEARLEPLRALPATRGVLQLDAFPSNATIKEETDERPWHPQILLVADAETGFIFGTELVPVHELPAALVNQLLGVLARLEQRPERVEVEREEIRALLKPVATRLGIRLIRVQRLPAIDVARHELTAFLGR
jgi:hypothetical protein